jgi:methylated-DNA-[protein]-cysteine S-methyltransferase
MSLASKLWATQSLGQALKAGSGAPLAVLCMGTDRVAGGLTVRVIMRGYAVEVATGQGPFGILADDEAVLASGWGVDAAALLAAVHPRLRPDEVIPVEQGSQLDAVPVLAGAVAAVRAYDDGSNLDAVMRVPVHTRGGAFYQAAWDVMRTIPAGEHLSYAGLAARAGKPGAARAAGGACARNPVPLFVPCHRVLRADGSLGGFAFGVARKADLLAGETGGTHRRPGCVGGAS